MPAPASAHLPRFSIVDGSSGVRRLLASMLRMRWSDADIDSIDPYSQTMHGAGLSSGHRADAIVLGGIGTQTEGVDALSRLRASAGCPPIVMLASGELADRRGLFAVAGAEAVLRKEALSASTLCTAVGAIVDGAPSNMEPPAASDTFAFTLDDERHAVDIDGYRYLANVASSPMAQVFLAERSTDRQRAIVKLLTAAGIGDVEAMTSLGRRFEFLHRLHGRHVVRYLDIGIADNWPFAAQEYLTGGDLRHRMREGLNARAALRILHGIVEALATVHTGGLAHMDLKPENIFFRADGSLALIDFNISTPFGDVARNRRTGDVLGTARYMSPEQGQGLPVDGRSDLYSAGVILFEMLAGEPPYAGDNPAQLIYRHIHDEVPLLPKGVRHLQPLIDRLLAKERDERFATSAGATAALQPFLAEPS